MPGYEITYSYPTAYGNITYKRIVGLTKDECERIREEIESLERYQLVDLKIETE